MRFAGGSRSPLRRWPLPALAATAALALGCGSDSGGRLLSQKQASELRDTLSAVEEDVAAKDCSSAAESVSALRTQVDDIRRLDRDLRRALRSSVRRLETLVEDQCAEATTPPAVETTPTTPSEGPTGATGDTGAEDEKDKKKEKKKEPKPEETPPAQDEEGLPGQQNGGGGAGVPGESKTGAGGD